MGIAHHNQARTTQRPAATAKVHVRAFPHRAPHRLAGRQIKHTAAVREEPVGQNNRRW
jgi:hypothetical protein